MATLELEAVRKVYANGTEAVRGIDLRVEDGEFLVLVGPSGCGKSTILRMIAGLEEITDGRLMLDGRDFTATAPEDRNLAMVFQSYALYPHMNVRRNLGFGLKLRGIDKRETETRVQEAARVLGLEELLTRKPAELSGGQRQRVALGRAMVRQPQAFLMDEPLSNLDAKLRVAMRAELVRLHERLGVTTIYVTHDQTEAMTLGDRVAVLDGGVLQQCAAPLELYERPVNLFVASFIGSPQMNLARARVRDARISIGTIELQLPARATVALPEDVIVGIRPEDFHPPGASGAVGKPTIVVEPAVVEELGAERTLVFPVEAAPVSGPPGLIDETLDEARILADQRTFFVARLPARTPARAGEPIELAVDTDCLYVFDPRSGETLLLPSILETAAP